jgi:hypothetical protein
MFPGLRERLRFFLEMMAGPPGPTRIDGKVKEHAVAPGRVDEDLYHVVLKDSHVVWRELF